jgi:hypothetical protein
MAQERLDAVVQGVLSSLRCAQRVKATSVGYRAVIVLVVAIHQRCFLGCDSHDSEECCTVRRKGRYAITITI